MDWVRAHCYSCDWDGYTDCLDDACYFCGEYESLKEIEMDLKTAIKETKEHLELNGGGDDDGFVSDEDALDHLADECGRGRDGSCSMAGSEYCSFECPFS